MATTKKISKTSIPENQEPVNAETSTPASENMNQPQGETSVAEEVHKPAKRGPKPKLHKLDEERKYRRRERPAAAETAEIAADVAASAAADMEVAANMGAPVSSEAPAAEPSFAAQAETYMAPAAANAEFSTPGSSEMPAAESPRETYEAASADNAAPTDGTTPDSTGNAVENGAENAAANGAENNAGQNANGQNQHFQRDRFNKFDKRGKFNKFDRNNRNNNNNNNNRPQQQQEEPEDVIPLPEPDSEAWVKARDCWAKYRKMTMSDLQELAKQKLSEQEDQDNRRIRKQSLGLLLQSMENENNIIYVEGLLEVAPQGNGYLRNAEFNYQPGPEDVYVHQRFIRKHGLKTGDTVAGLARPPRPNDKFYALRRVDKINFEDPKSIENRVAFEYLTPVHPYEKINLEWNSNELTTRVMDMFSPIGKGQRSIILAPPRTGKTILLQNMTRAIAKNHPEMTIMVLLIDERPEEVTEMREIVGQLVDENPALRAEVVASTFDEPPEHHARVATMVLEKAKRLVEQRRDVVVLLDSITRFARANNVVIPHSGKILSGGVDANAMQFPKKFFGAARKIADKFGDLLKDADGDIIISETGEPMREIIQKNGSLTIVGTALIDTGSRMDEVIFEEFKGTGNMELVLDRRLAEKRTWPAIDIFKSGTRKEERLLSIKSRNAIWNFRQKTNQMETENGVMDKLIELMTKEERDPVTNKKRRLYDTNAKLISFWNEFPKNK